MPKSTRRASAPQITPIEFRDFTPGIADLPGIDYPNEQATRANTYRCRANRSGALVPLPRRDFSQVAPDLVGANLVGGQYVISGFHIPSYDIQAVAPNPSDAQGRYHALWLTVSYQTSVGATSKIQAVLIRQWLATPTTLASAGLLVTGVASKSAGVGSSFATTRMNRTTPTSPGVPVTFIGMQPPDVGVSGLREFPNDSTPASDTPYNPSISSTVIASHQGRVLVGQLTVYQYGTVSQAVSSEELVWSNVNDPTIFSSTQVFAPEYPVGYSFMVSMSANELLLVKRRGAALVEGDLDNPTVINLPMVEGANPPHEPAVSNIGVVYGNHQSGVWVWQHGDTSRLISSHMDSDFWEVLPQVLGSDSAVQDQSNFNAFSFAPWDDFILTPNNFLYDTISQSWWRIEDPAVLTCYRFQSWRGFLYGVPQTYTRTNLTAIYGWNRALGATSYSWQSQPIWESIDRLLTIREVELIAQGRGTITLTLTALDNTTTSVTITLSNTGFPERHRLPVSVTGFYLQLRIEADSTFSTVDAPTIYAVTLHPDTRSRVPIG